MLVVIPVCHKDEALVLKNLDWVAELDGKIDGCYHISCPEGFDYGPVARMADDIFSQVRKTSQYPEWGGHQAWPMPQNWAWQSTARHVQPLGMPWLWWEADATPISKGWHDVIREEYKAGGKPFMGCITDQMPGFEPHMNGVGVYPADVAQYTVKAMLCRAAPFDVVAWPDVQSRTYRANHLIQHHCRVNGDSTHFPTSASVDEIVNPGVVLFHRCKDGSLIDRLRERKTSVVKKLISTVSSMFTSSDITVVITNFKRPDKVKEAFESCLAAKVENVVISASGCDAELKTVHQQCQKQKPNLRIDAITDDLGCNEMWLRGVRLAKTKWVHILHDDDKLLPEFATLERYIGNGAPFYHWDGLKHAWPTSLLDPAKLSQRTFQGRQQDFYSTDMLWPVLLQEGSYSISPISALFPRQHVLDTLEEVEREMKDCRFFYSHKMQVGNDLLLWLRACENYSRFFYIPRPFISYGHWDGSTTFWDYGCNLQLLAKCYDATRDYFLNGPGFEMHECPRIIHVQSNFDGDMGPRIENARKAWADQYRRGNWVREGISDNSLPRLFADGPRRIPYLLDMIDRAVNIHGKEPIYVLSNTDTIPVRSLTRHLVRTFQMHYDCAYSFRRDISQIEKRDEKTIRTNTAVYPGCDLFAFTAQWWQTARKAFPDMLYATDTWDYCLRHYMDKTFGKRFYYLIYHVAHANELSRNQGSLAHAHNHSLAQPFLEKMGVEAYWLAKSPPNLNPR